MITKIFVVWFLAVVSFFALWAILALIIRRISEKKDKNNQNKP